MGFVSQLHERMCAFFSPPSARLEPINWKMDFEEVVYSATQKNASNFFASNSNPPIEFDFEQDSNIGGFVATIDAAQFLDILHKLKPKELFYYTVRDSAVETQWVFFPAEGSFYVRTDEGEAITKNLPAYREYRKKNNLQHWSLYRRTMRWEH